MQKTGNCPKCYEYGNLNSHCSHWRCTEYICDKCKAEEEGKDRIIKILESAQSLLNNGNFLESDRLVLEKHSEKLLKEYDRKKFECVSIDLRNLEKKLGETDKKIKEGYFDDEKATVLSTTGKNILVQARAGSGKTETVALRVRQLIKFYSAKPHEILVLAFNKKAAKEFRDRIEKYCGSGIATEANTLTFHALGKRIANTEKTLLDGEKILGVEESRHGQDKKLQIDFIRECFNAVEKKERGFIEKLFYYFLKTASEKTKGAFQNDDEYYFYLRNLRQITIAGEYVKSKYEKYIADFLFEHTISKNGRELAYVYEHNVKKFLNAKYPYNPDFSLFYTEDKQREQLQAVIEYFGFTQKNTGYPGFFDTEKESRDYIKKSFEKRELLRSKGVKFVEMSADDFDKIVYNNGQDGLDENLVRLEFEKIVQQRLINCGFDISAPLNIKEILAKIPKAERHKEKLVKQITRFINKAQKLSYGPDEIRGMAETEKKNGNLSNRNEFFIKIVCRVYDEYRSRLEKENYTDFDGLFIDAIKKIEKELMGCKIVYHGEEEVGNIKYILIDEYQDFSELFYQLINQIREANPSISFFCVGDDWQAINGFAGSDLKYFDNFGTYFVDGRRTSLLTNYRSYASIVQYSNSLMSGRGLGGKPKADTLPGAVHRSSVVQYVEWQQGEEYSEKYRDDDKYRTAAKSLGGRQNKWIEISRYLKTVELIVRDKTFKEICLLFRTQELYGVKISKFAEQICTLSPQFCTKQSCYSDKDSEKNKKECEKKGGHHLLASTVHSFKGKESDVIIVVDANRGSYPKIHPDNELMELLGVTMSKVLDEERRLFYVAVTRAREELYMLYEEEIGHSDFISF